MKGIALDELAYLIIAIILVSILLVIFFVFQFPFMVFPIVLFDHLSTFIRGFVIAGIWTAFWAFLGLFSALIWISMANPECWGPQAAGCAAKNAIEEAIIIGVLTGLAFSFTSQIPLAYKSIQLQENNVSIDKHLGDWILDTSYMANAGTNDPFRGTSTNPKISFIITVKKGDVNLSHALERLEWPTYSIYDKITGKVWDNGLVMENKWWHVDKFNVDIKIAKNKNTGNWEMWAENSSNNYLCDFNHTNYGHSWSHPWVLGKELTPQENVFSCNEITHKPQFKIFVSQSELNSNRIHVTIGKYVLRYSKLKNLVVIINNGNPHEIISNKLDGEFTLVPTNKKVFNIKDLENVKLKKGAVIYIDYLDTCDFCGYKADECGGNINDVKEGVYVCIPKISG